MREFTGKWIGDVDGVRVKLATSALDHALMDVTPWATLLRRTPGHPPPMKRREFLGLTATGAAGLILPAAAGGRGTEATTLSMLAATQLLAVVHDARIVAEIGRRYRELVPAENDVAGLAGAILNDVEPGADQALPERLDACIRRDFAGGRIVTLDGWVVAVTEARQCALYSLVAR